MNRNYLKKQKYNSHKVRRCDGITEFFSKLSIVDKIFSTLLESWESAKKTTAYAESYAKANGLSYARPVQVIVKGDGIFKKIKVLLSKSTEALKRFSFSLAANLLKQVLDYITMIPRVLRLLLKGEGGTYDEQIADLLDKKAGKISNMAGKFCILLKNAITKILNLLLNEAINKSTFDPNAGEKSYPLATRTTAKASKFNPFEYSQPIDIKTRSADSRRKRDSRLRRRRIDAYFVRRFHDDLTNEIHSFFKNISLIATTFKSGEVTQGYLMLKALQRMIAASLGQYKDILWQRFSNAFKSGSLKEAAKMTFNEILDTKKLLEALKTLQSVVGNKGKDILREIMSKLFSFLKLANNFIVKMKSKNNQQLKALPSF